MALMSAAAITQPDHHPLLRNPSRPDLDRLQHRLRRHIGLGPDKLRWSAPRRRQRSETSCRALWTQRIFSTSTSSASSERSGSW